MSSTVARTRNMKKTGPAQKVLATKQAKAFIAEAMKEVLSESEEVLSAASSDDEVPPLRPDITAFSSFKAKQQLLQDCSTTDADLDLSGGNSLSNWWSDTDDEDKEPAKGLGATMSTMASTFMTTASTTFDSAAAVPSVVPVSAQEAELRRSFYLALRKADATHAVAQLQAALPQTMELQVLHTQVELALEFLRDAEWTRTQLWALFCRSPGRAAGYCDCTPAGAAGQTQRMLRQARHLLSSLPAALAAQWDPRSSGEVLGRLAFAPPVRLLGSLCDTVEGTPSLRGPTACMQQALLVA